MTALRLKPRRVEKVWGRRDLGEPFRDVAADAEPVGEIWFEAPPGREAPLLVKYLFTSERLSIQVHPDEAMAKADGAACGKDEAWLVLSAEPGATIGLGLTRKVGRDALREAALDGSIETLVDWRPVRAGDVFYSPAGTVHSIGAGLRLIEVQQNVDFTYRLYDYGRPRQLHLEKAVAAARPEPFRAEQASRRLAEGRTQLCAGDRLRLERCAGPGRFELEGAAWIVPLRGGASLDGSAIDPGSVWMTDAAAILDLGAEADALVAFACDPD
ncbi:MAG: mannose-6-phosphate isomerase [Sphingomonadales bacterium]|jgi:mannose-6-phosphate isomerase|nr:mannose-6-phosphate isomerase [Sphingomonadales bacterium]